MTSPKQPKHLFASGEVIVRSNGEGAKTAPVTIVCSTGQPFWYSDDTGMFVWDHASVTMPRSKIPLDWDHDEDWSIGWLNNMDAQATGNITVSGAIVRNPADESVIISDSLADGIPFQASCETHNFRLDVIPAGQPVTVNGRDLVGPITVCRDWELAAVAICKWGKDDGTSVSLAASKRKNEHEQVKNLKASNINNMGTQMDTKTEAAVEATNEVVKAADPMVEVKAKVETAAPAVVVEAVDAVKTEATAPVVEPVEKKDEAVVVEQKADPRAEYKSFVKRFGEQQGANYYAKDMSMDQAVDAHFAYLAASVDDLSKRLTASKASGVAGPIVFNDTAAKIEPKKASKSLDDMIRFNGPQK